LPKRFHLAWFTNFTAGNWHTTFSLTAVRRGTASSSSNFAQAMERARFDYTILEDTFMVSEAWGGTAEMPRAQALQMPKHYPLPRSTLRETLHEF